MAYDQQLADMIRGNADLRQTLREINALANIPPAEGSINSRMHQVWLLSRGHEEPTHGQSVDGEVK